jgi:uncharacterized membrane protein
MNGVRVIEPVIWLIKRNGSASPRQLACVFASLGAVSFAFGAGFAVLGYWMVFPFVGVELAAVAAAFVVFARHAADFERIEIGDAGVIVERHEGARRSEVRFDLPWVRVEVTRREVDVGSSVRVDVVSKRQRVEVGRYLVDARRMALARELKAALAGVARGSGGNAIRG